MKTVPINEDLHRKLKQYSIKFDMNLKEFVEVLLKEQINKIQMNLKNNKNKNIGGTIG